jgi:sulfoacetaldehyde dehydrogenase
MAIAVAIEAEEVGVIEALLARARAAQRAFADASQETADFAVQAAGWALLEPGRNRSLSEQAVADTGFGEVADKVAKNRRKTLGLLRDLQTSRSVGVLTDDPATGITEIARPVGLVAAITPSTNPVATPANNIINALKGRNAVVLAPAPKATGVCERLVGFVQVELAKLGLPPELVQMLPPPASKALTRELMRQADLVVATGSRSNVKAAYSSGTPALGVGVGNVAAIVAANAVPALTASRITQSETFDNATSCSSENSLVIVDSRWDELLPALTAAGGVLATAAEATRLQAAMFPNGKLDSAFVAKPAPTIAALAQLGRAAFRTCRFIMVDETGQAAGPERPFSGEKLSPVLALYRVPDFAAAIAQVASIYDYQGKGHSVGVHGASDAEIMRCGLELPVCRVIVDQVHAVATGGAANNGLPVSLSMGCGTWGGNSFSENLNYRHFLNITRIVRPIAPRPAYEEELLGEYWSRYGR